MENTENWRPRLLILEDIEYWQHEFDKLVRRLGYIPEMASTWEDAFAKLNRTSFDVALVDLRLDDEDRDNWDGMKVLERIRDIGEGTSMVVLTAYGEAKHAAHAFRKYDIQHFIRKDEMSPEDVEQEIQEALKESELKESLRLLRSKSPFNLISGLSPDRIVQELQCGKQQELRAFLQRMFYSLRPLLPDRQEAKIVPIEDVLAVEVRLWSKALGQPILAKFGRPSEMKAFVEKLDASLEAMQEAGYLEKVKDVFDKTGFPHLGGAVYILSEVDFEEFEAPQYPEPEGWTPKRNRNVRR